VIATFDQKAVRVFRHASPDWVAGQLLAEIPSPFALEFLAAGPGQLLYAGTKQGAVFRIATD
jgi:hypothetical protein